METDTEAGPSKPRRQSPQPVTPKQSDIETEDDENGPSTSTRPSRPASPETAFASRLTEDSAATPEEQPPRPPSPHLDLATYPTATLLRLIANLLQQIASANDQLRPDNTGDGDTNKDDEEMQDQSSKSGSSRASSVAPSTTISQPSPSPKTALFNDTDSSNQPSTNNTSLVVKRGIDPSSPLPLFSASRTSLVHPSSLLSFHARHIPSISIEAYLLRILKYCPTTNEVFLSLLVYFDRMSRLGTSSGVGAGLVGSNGKGFAIDSYNVHRLVIAGVTVASKFFSDVFYTNSRYAKVGGLPPHELNQLELQFLLLNDFRLAIPTDEMQRYGDRLLSYWDGREEETGVDIETGKELSENGKKRAKEKRERERAKSQPTVEDVERVSKQQEQDNESEVSARPASEGNGESSVSESHPKDPAQPPPEPSETASAPLDPVDKPENTDGAVSDKRDDTIAREDVRNLPGNGDATPKIPNPPKHSATAPTVSSSHSSARTDEESAESTPTVESPIQTDQANDTNAPTLNGAKADDPLDPISASAARPKEVTPSTAGRSVSFSRGDMNGIGRGWAGGERGAVAVNGTG